MSVCINILRITVLLIIVSIGCKNNSMSSLHEVEDNFYLHLSANINGWGPEGSYTRRKTFNLFKDVQLEFGQPPN